MPKNLVIIHYLHRQYSDAAQSTVSEINSISRNATAAVLVMCNDGDAGQPRGRRLPLSRPPRESRRRR